MMDVESMLSSIKNVSKDTYAIVEDGKCRIFHSMKDIKAKDIENHKMPKDGVYVVTKNVCSGKYCSIGKPSKKRIEKGRYSEKTCATYSLTDVKEVKLCIKYSDLFMLMRKII